MVVSLGQVSKRTTNGDEKVARSPTKESLENDVAPVPAPGLLSMLDTSGLVHLHHNHPVGCMRGTA